MVCYSQKASHFEVIRQAVMLTMWTVLATGPTHTFLIISARVQLYCVPNFRPHWLSSLLKRIIPLYCNACSKSAECVILYPSLVLLPIFSSSLSRSLRYYLEDWKYGTRLEREHCESHVTICFFATLLTNTGLRLPTVHLQEAILEVWQSFGKGMFRNGSRAS